MGKLVVIKLEDGSFNEGFPVKLEIGEEGKRHSTEIKGRLPADPQVPIQYNRWQQAYRSLGGRRRVSGMTQEITEVSPEVEQACRKSAEALEASLNNWLADKEFDRIREALIEQLARSQESRVVIQTDDSQLQRVPWHLWNLFERYPQAEVALSPSEYNRVTAVRTGPKAKVRILAILGSSDGINIERDRKELKQLPKAETCFLVEPQRKELSDRLYEEQWDILFFAGHSSSQEESEKGRIYLNRADSLTIGELKSALRTAIHKGLKLAIFNSCDGLGLARAITDLQIPQVIFMREPVPDRVAQEFLKYFLSPFARGKSLPLAVREARGRLQGIENEFIYASWLPVVYHNSTEAPLAWQDILDPPYDLVWARRAGLVLALGVVAVFVFFGLNPQYPDSALLHLVRFLAAGVAGASAFLSLGGIRIKEPTPLNKSQIRAYSAFASSLVVFLVFLYGLPAKNDFKDFEGIYDSAKPIEFRHLTGIGEYATLSFLETLIPQHLLNILGIDQIPVIQTNNPVYESLERFREESGNENWITQASDRLSGRVYRLNQNSRTVEDSALGLRVIPQSKKDFDSEIVQHIDKFVYAPVIMPFEDSLDNAPWTIESRDIRRVKYITQYPSLSQVKEIGIKDEESENSQVWIEKIATANPKQRGFLAYTYQYLQDISGYFFYGCEEPYKSLFSNILDRKSSELYLRFVDIKNPNWSSIKLDSLQYKIIENKPYALTKVDKRDTLFQDVKTESKELRISIPPQQHLLIPIELGFDTKTLTKGLSGTVTASFSKENRVIYVPKLLRSEELDKLGRQMDTKSLTKKVILTQEFLSRIRSEQEILNSIPGRLAVGSFIDIESITVNGKKIKIGSPLNEASSSISNYFDLGSCPYLVAYNSEKREWTDLGTVLYGRRNKSLQDYEIHSLGENVSKFKLEEREPEITYIDSLSILYADPETRETREVIHPMPELANADGEYFLLHQGESLEINLKKFVPANASDVQLKINGYYEIIE